MTQAQLTRFFVSVFLRDYNIDGSYFDDEKKPKKIKCFYLEIKNIYKKNKGN
jgi:hypothetical protein